jgi:hypothetical protein
MISFFNPQQEFHLPFVGKCRWEKGDALFADGKTVFDDPPHSKSFRRSDR